MLNRVEAENQEALPRFALISAYLLVSQGFVHYTKYLERLESEKTGNITKTKVMNWAESQQDSDECPVQIISSVDEFTLYTMLATIAIRVFSLAFGYAFKGHKMVSMRKISMLRELSPTIWFSFTGSAWFLWSLYARLSLFNRGCLAGFNINFMLVGAYTAVLFCQTACVILCMPCLIYIENKIQVCKQSFEEGSVSEQVST